MNKMKCLSFLLTFSLLNLGIAKEDFGAHVGSLKSREVGNGGDRCSKDFKEIAKDLSSWITRGGANDLDFFGKTDLASYKESMLAKIINTRVFCTEKTVSVGASDKTCVNANKSKILFRYLSDEIKPEILQELNRDKKPIIICNYRRFNELSIDEQYHLTHHEYAGLAGIEANNGKEESNYEISDQISGYLEIVETGRLAVQNLEKLDFCLRSQSIQNAVMNHLNTYPCSKISLRDIRKIKKLKIQSAQYFNNGDFYNFYGLKHLEVNFIKNETGGSLYLNKGMFKGLTHLKNLSLSVNKKSDINLVLRDSTFSSMPALKELRISGLNFNEIGADLFTPVSSKMKSLSIAANEFYVIKEGAFDHLTGLETIGIEGGIEKLPPGVFDKLLKLRLINILWTQIPELPVGVFRNQEKLENLSISYGELKSIAAATLRPLKSLLYLSISHQKLERLPENLLVNQTLLKELNLDGNKRISYLPQGIFRNLKNVSILTLKLDTVNPNIPENLFEGLDVIDELYLSGVGAGNAVTNGQLKHLGSLRELSVSDGFFVEGPFGSSYFSLMPRLETLSLDSMDLWDYFFTDDSIAELQALGNLELLTLSANDFSEEFKDKLHDELDGIMIEFD